MFDNVLGRHPVRHWAVATLTGVLALAALPAAAQAADAATYPNKPLRMIVGMPAGGATDIMARLLAEKMGAALGQQIVVENRPGAGAIIGTDAVAKSAPDGYTISVILSATVTANRFIYSQLPYNPDTDFTYLAQLAHGAVVLGATANQPFNTAREFVDYAKANPGKVTYGSYSPGSFGHVVMAYLDDQLGSKMTHVGYRGEAPMLQDMLGGRLDVAFGSAVNMGPHMQAGKLKPLGVTGPQRMSALPDVPTLAEQGLTDEPFRMFGWIGLIAPSGIPQPIVDKIAAATNVAMQDPAVQQRVRALGFEPVTDSTPEKTLARYEADVPMWKKLVEISGAKID